jgi:NADH-quinone oxidoreductase subunit J
VKLFVFQTKDKGSNPFVCIIFYGMLFIFNLIILGIFLAFLVIFLKNPVYSVLSLVFLFVITSILLLFLEIEFFALLYIIVYVGAVAVLFLFVIMMLDLRQKTYSYSINYFLFSFLFVCGLYNIYYTITHIFFFSFLEILDIFYTQTSHLIHHTVGFNDLYSLNILFSKNYGILLIITGIMFFIVMLGTINLHLQQQFPIGFLKNKNINNFIDHNLKDSIKLRGFLKDISFYEKVLYTD